MVNRGKTPPLRKIVPLLGYIWTNILKYISKHSLPSNE